MVTKLYSRFFCKNADVDRNSILGSMLFLTFINGFPNRDNPQVGVYADGTSIYFYLDSKSIGKKRSNFQLI